MGCKECPYRNKIKVPFIGNPKAKIVFVGESPGEEELKAKKPFVGKSGRLLMDSLKKICGISRSEIALLNAMKCMADSSNKKEMNLAMKNCRPFVKNTLLKIKPKLIVTLGSIATKQIIGNGNKITSNSGKFVWSNEFNCWVLISIHPSYALRNGVSSKKLNVYSTASRLWTGTFQKIRLFISNNYNYYPIDTKNYKELTDEDKDKILNSKIVAIDYETTGLNPFNSEVKLISLSFTIKEGKSRVILDFEREKDFIKQVLTNPDITKVVANRPFEELFTYKKLGFHIKGKVHDVLTMAHIINEDNCQTYSLEQVAELYANMPNIKELAEGQRETLEKADKDLIIRYNGVDTDATFRAYKKLSELLSKEDALKRYYLRLIKPAQDMYAKISLRGFPIDLMYVRQLENELREVAEGLEKEALDLLPESIKEEYKDKLRLTIPSLIIDYLFNHKDGLRFKPLEFTEKTGLPTTSEKHLKQFQYKSRFVNLLLRWKKANKILTTYFKMIYESVNPEDSKIYPQTLFIATKTGRLVIKNPSLQVIPQRGEFASYVKKIFKAPEGYYIFERDLGQSELRIMGWLSNCKNILKALHNNIDLHKQTANLILGIPLDKVTKQQRQSCKAINFGFIYGAMPKTFQEVAKNDYGINFTLEEATKLREKYFKVYPEVLQFHKKVIDFARRTGYVSSPLGRRRHLYNINSEDFWLRSEAERQAINFPIQSFSSDLNLISQIILEKYIEKEGLEDEIQTLFLIHDAMFGIVREDKVKLAQWLTKQAMEVWSKKYIKKYFGVDVNYPIASEFAYGKSWDDLKEVEDVFD